MSQKTQTIQNQYEVAINDLKQMNNDLFYSDLKKHIQAYQDDVKNRINENEILANAVNANLKGLLSTFAKKMDELNISAEVFREEQIDQFNKDFEIARTSLLKACKSFQTVATNFEKRSVEVEQKWDEHLNQFNESITTTNKDHTIQLQQNTEEFQMLIKAQQESFLTEQKKAKKEFMDLIDEQQQNIVKLINTEQIALQTQREEYTKKSNVALTNFGKSNEIAYSKLKELQAEQAKTIVQKIANLKNDLEQQLEKISIEFDEQKNVYVENQLVLVEENKQNLISIQSSIKQVDKKLNNTILYMGIFQILLSVVVIILLII